MINSTDIATPRRDAAERLCPGWCTNGDHCRGEHWGDSRRMSASLYGSEFEGRTEVYLGAVQEDMGNGQPGVSLSIAQFAKDGLDEDGVSAFLTVDELRQLVAAAHVVLGELDA